MQAYPEELIVPPCPLVCIISDAPYIEMLAVALKSAPVGNTMTSLVNMRYEPRPAKYTLPVTKKPKETNHYETYIPENILKSNWMHKHQNDIPAVMVSSSTVVVVRRTNDSTRKSENRWIEMSMKRIP